MRILGILSFVFIGLSAMGQSYRMITWDDLTDVSFENKYYERYDTDYMYPTFGEQIKKFDGKKIRIQGYIIAVEKETGFYVLSANPYAACFFCGNAGPETVLKLNFDGWPDDYVTDSFHTFEGILKLNAENIFELNYILEGAEHIN